MKTCFLLHITIAIHICAIASAHAKDAAIPSSSISDSNRARIETAMDYLASDELKGRAIGTPEIDEAARFIASKFRELGLNTQIFDGLPYQEFSIPGGFEIPISTENQLAFQSSKAKQKGDGQQENNLELGVDFTPLAIGGAGQFNAPVVFVGFGISSPENRFDEYANMDVNGKVVVILRKEPQQSNKNSVFNGDRPSTHAYFTTKVQNAISHGAAAVVLVNDQAEQARNSKRPIVNWKRQSSKLARLIEEGPRSDSLTDFRAHRKRVERLLKGLGKFAERIDQADKLLRPAGAGNSPVDKNIPVIFCRRESVREMIETVTMQSLEEIELAIDADLQPRSLELSGWTAKGKVNISRKTTTVKNILAVLEGKGELANESIIIGAHYDHVGMGGAGSLAPWTSAVHNGADDNASGVVAMLEVARILARQTNKPRRRIVFIAFTAEETGLLGSQHYVDHPRFDLDNTTAMLNLDMVGRIGNQPLQVHGVGTSRRLEEIVDDVASAQEFSIKKSQGGNGPSDHASFNSKRIPVLHFFSGLHSDYHRPGDDVDKINFEGIARVSKLTAQIAMEIDSESKRLAYQRRFPILGVQINENEAGCEISQLATDGPAARVGLVPNDVIIRVNGRSVAKMSDLTRQLTAQKPGNAILLTVLHEKAQQTFKVQLGEPR